MPDNLDSLTVWGCNAGPSGACVQPAPMHCRRHSRCTRLMLCICHCAGSGAPAAAARCHATATAWAFSKGSAIGLDTGATVGARGSTVCARPSPGGGRAIVAAGGRCIRGPGRRPLRLGRRRAFPLSAVGALQAPSLLAAMPDTPSTLCSPATGIQCAQAPELTPQVGHDVMRWWPCHAWKCVLLHWLTVCTTNRSTSVPAVQSDIDEDLRNVLLDGGVPLPDDGPTAATTPGPSARVSHPAPSCFGCN
jgi:hypothetical protein